MLGVSYNTKEYVSPISINKPRPRIIVRSFKSAVRTIHPPSVLLLALSSVLVDTNFADLSASWQGRKKSRWMAKCRFGAIFALVSCWLYGLRALHHQGLEHEYTMSYRSAIVWPIRSMNRLSKADVLGGDVFKQPTKLYSGQTSYASKF